MNKLLLIGLTLSAFMVGCKKGDAPAASSQAECESQADKKWVGEKCEDRVYYTVTVKGGKQDGKEDGAENYWPPHAVVDITTTKDHHWNKLTAHGDCVKVEDVYFQDGGTVTVAVNAVTAVLEASHYEVVYDYPTGETVPANPTATDYIKVNKVDTANTANNCVLVQQDIEHPEVVTPPADGTQATTETPTNTGN